MRGHHRRGGRNGADIDRRNGCRRRTVGSGREFHLGQGSPVFVWGAVDGRVSDIRITNANGKVAAVQFTALPPDRRMFVAVLPANTKKVTITATAAAGDTLTTSNLTTIFGAPDALATPETPSASPTAAPPATTSAVTTTVPPTTVTTAPTSTSPPASPVAGCDGPGMGIGIADRGFGSGLVSLNYLQTAKKLCFSNGGLSGAVADIRREMDTNFYGTLLMTRALGRVSAEDLPVDLGGCGAGRHRVRSRRGAGR